MDNSFSKLGTSINVNKINKEVFANQSSRPTPREEKNSATGIFDKIIYISLFMLFTGLPLFFTGLAFQGVVFEKQIYFYFWVLVALVAWAAKGVLTGEMRIKRTPLDIPIFVFVAIYAVSTFLSVDRWHSFWGFFGDPSRGLMTVISCVIIYYLILSNFNKKNFNWIIGGLVFSSAIISIFSILIFFGVTIVPAGISSLVPLSLVGTVSGLKIFSGMMLPIIMIAFFKMNESEKRWVNLASYVLLVLIPMNLLLISMIFDTTIAFIILFGVGFFLLYVLSLVVRPKANLTWVPMVVFLGAMIVTIIGGNSLAKINTPIEVAPNPQVSWEVVKGGLRENALFGSGPATYGYDFSKYKPLDFNQNIFYGIRFYQGSGLFFESFSTLGILGMVSLLTLAVVFINVAIYLISRDKERNKIYSLGVLSATLILLFSAFMFRVEGTILLLGALMGSLTMAIIYLESGINDKYLNLSLKASPKFALTLAFVFIIVSAGVATLFVYIGKAYVADIYAGEASREKSITEEGSVASLQRAIRLNAKEGRYASRLGQEFMVLANQEAAKGEGKVDAEKLRIYVNNAIYFSKLGADLMPNDALAVSVLAQIYESLALYANNALGSASETYERLLVLEPHNPLAYLKLGQIKIVPAISEKDEEKKKQSIQEAQDFFKKAIVEKDNYAEAHYYLAVTQNALGKKDEVIDSMFEAVKNENNNITYLFNLARAYQERGSESDIDNASKLFEHILTKNPEEINTVFASGTLYEKKGEKDLAVERYQKVIEILNKMNTADNSDTISRLNRMIDNVKKGVDNNNQTVLEGQPENVQAGQPVGPENQQDVELIGSDPTQNPVNTTTPPPTPNN